MTQCGWTLRLTAYSLAVCAIAAVPAAWAQQPAASEGAPAYSPLPGLDKTAMDTTADPCSNFYQYACGNFQKLHPIPSDLPLFDQFANLYEFNIQALHGILEKTAAAHGAMGTNEQKIGDYYQSCMNTDAIEKKGIAP